MHAAVARPAILPRPIRMDWLYVRDAAAGIAALLGKTAMHAQRVVDLGGGARFDLLQWGAAVGKHRPGVVCRVATSGETPNVLYFMPKDRSPLDNGAIERETGFCPQYDLLSAAADYASWLSRSRIRERAAMMQEGAEAERIAALAEQVRRDLARIAHPRMPWMEPRVAPDGKPALDVLIIGAGQSGLAIAFGLMRAQVGNILVIDKAEYGREGPWLTYARMRTLRSPKDYTGPDLDVPSLTYQAWHEARFGVDSWNALELIPRELWAEYLLWMREVAIPVRNGWEVMDIAPSAGDLIAVTVERDGSNRETLHARKLVLATGQEGMGGWWMPDFVSALPSHLRAHAADAIDFEALRGRTVAVLGAGASALDNAAVALEHGASEVHLFCRRMTPQLVQPFRWLTFAGFLRHLSDLDDAWRWRFMSTILGLREGFPQETWDRCARHANFQLHTGAPWLGARATGDGVELQTPKGPFHADFPIRGRAWTWTLRGGRNWRDLRATSPPWGDRHSPPPEQRNERLARFPYLGGAFELIEKHPGETPWIGNIHVFAIASTMSFGPSGSSINAMTTAVRKLIDGMLTRGLFKGDVERHWQSLLQHQAVRRRLLRLRSARPRHRKTRQCFLPVSLEPAVERPDRHAEPYH